METKITTEWAQVHAEELAQALTVFSTLFQSTDYDTLMMNALKGSSEISDSMQFCMEHTNDAQQIPFVCGNTTQMMYDYRHVLESLKDITELLQNILHEE